MLIQLHKELEALDLQYHDLNNPSNNSITLHANSLEAEGIDEVMKIKAMADQRNLITTWDGQNIEIRRHQK